jgi:hypothetical protein
LSSGVTLDSNFIVPNFSVNDQQYPDVKLWNARIYNVWEVKRNNKDYNIWANVLDWNNPSGIIKNNLQRPETFFLHQNYPNPFNPETTIEFYLPYSTEVQLEIFNILGQKIRTLAADRKIAGVHQVKWDGNDDTGREVTSGFYIYQLKAGDHINSKKMLLLK